MQSVGPGTIVSRSRTVRTRRVGFDFAKGTVPRHYVGGDVLSSHLLTLASAVFPAGEDFFVRTVRYYRDRITDPELRAQVQGSIGQEAMHGRAHRDFNGALGELGYPTRLVGRSTEISLGLAERVLPRHVQLAITAALEHYTATVAEVLLRHPEQHDRFANDDLRALFAWHALEESEHKAVAFEVFQTISGSHRVRAWVMRLITLDLIVGTLIGLCVSLARDPEARSVRRLRASFRELRRSPLARREVAARLRNYKRPDFHPDDNDTSALVEEWRRRLFGPGGRLADRTLVSA